MHVHELISGIFFYFIEVTSRLQNNHKLVKFWQCVNHNTILQQDAKLRFTNEDVYWGDTDDKVLFIRECYGTTKHFIEDNKLTKALIIGTPGIGKTLFIFWFMREIVSVAKAENLRVPTSTPTFVYSNRLEEKYYFHIDNDAAVVNIYDGTTVPDYFISDTVPNSSFSSLLLNLHVSSVHDKASDQFYNTFNDFGKTITFPTCSYDEFQQVDGLFSEDNQCTNSNELQFKYDIFGGSLRLLRTRVNDIANEEIHKFVSDELLFYFGDVYVSNLYPPRRRPQQVLLLDAYKTVYINASKVITYKLCSRIEGADDRLNASTTFRSLFKHRIFVGFDERGDLVWNDGFASGFMKSLAGAIIQRENLNIYAELKSLVQAGGMGCLFERQAHEEIYNNLKNNKKYCLVDLKGRKNIYLEQPITRKVLIRRVEDIVKLLPTDYGLPVISNFPLVDAIIQPKYMIQATESSSHIGAITQLTSIRNQLLERNHDMQAMVFVLSEKNYTKFKQVQQLEVNQYKSYAYAVANESVQSVKRKREN